jgi:ankyrin repeat protein
MERTEGTETVTVLGGETPLHWVVKLRYRPEEEQYVTTVRHEVHSGHTICIRHLIVAGADVDAKSKVTGRTALHESVRRGFDEITRLLIYEFNADCNIEDNEGQTPKSLAGHSRLRSLMDDYEAAVAKQTFAKKTPQTPPARTAQP